MNHYLENFRQALENEDKRPATVQKYLADLKQFAAWFKQTNGETFAPPAITPTDVIGFRSFLLTLKGCQPATVNRKLASLSRFCRWAKGQGLITDDPSAGVGRVRQEKPPSPKALTRQEWLKLLRTVQRSRNKRDIALVELMGNTGLRVSEVAALTLEDIQISPRKGQVVVRQGKGMKQRRVPLNADARKAISDYLAVRPAVGDNHLFIGQRGSGLTTSGIWRIIKKYGQQAGLNNLHPHLLRNTYATRLLREEGVDLVLVQKTLGHESPATTARYTWPTEEEEAAALEKLAIRQAAPD